MSSGNFLVKDTSRPGMFSGLTFVVHLAGPQFRGFPKDKDSFTNQLRKYVLKRICANGGIVVGVEDRFIAGANYVIATHEKQRAVLEARQAQDQGACIRIYGPQWVLACVDNQQLITEEPEHWGLLAGPHDPGIPGFRDFTNHIRVSGVPADRRDFRMLLLYWVECMGGRSANETAAIDTSHVLTWNSGTLTPAQLEIEQRYPHVRHVHYTWLMLCRSSWEMVDDVPFRLVPPDAVKVCDISQSKRALAHQQHHDYNRSNAQVYGNQDEAPPPQQQQQRQGVGEDVPPHVGRDYCQRSGKDADNLSWQQRWQPEASAACDQGAFLPRCSAREADPAPALRHLPSYVKEEPIKSCEPVGPQVCKMESGSDAGLHEGLSCAHNGGSCALQQANQRSQAGSNMVNEHPCRAPHSVGYAGAYIGFGQSNGSGASCIRAEDDLQTGWRGNRHREIERPEQVHKGKEPQPQEQQQQQQGQGLLREDLGVSEAGHFRRPLTPDHCKVTVPRCLEEPLRSPLKPLDTVQQPWLVPIRSSPPSARCDLRATSAAHQEANRENGDRCLVNTPTKDYGHECSKPAVGSSAPAALATASPSTHAAVPCPRPGYCLEHDTRSPYNGNAGCGTDATTPRDQVECSINCLPSVRTRVQSRDNGANRLNVRTSNANSIGVSSVDQSVPTSSMRASVRLEPQSNQVNSDAHVVTGIAELSHGVGKREESQGAALMQGAPVPSVSEALGSVSLHAEARSWHQEISGLAVHTASADNEKISAEGSFGRARRQSSERGESADRVPSGNPRVKTRKMATTTTRGTLRSRHCEADLLQDVGIPSCRGRGRVKTVQISGPAPLKARPDAVAVALSEETALATVETHGMPGHLSSSGHTDGWHTAMEGTKTRPQTRQGWRRRQLSDAETPPDPSTANMSSKEPGGGAGGAAAAAAADDRRGKCIGNADHTPEHNADQPEVPEGLQCKEVGLQMDKWDVIERGADGTEQAALPTPGLNNRQGYTDSGMDGKGGGCDGAWRNNDLDEGTGDAMEVDPVQPYRTADPDHASGPADTSTRVVIADLVGAQRGDRKQPAGWQSDDNNAKTAQEELEPKCCLASDNLGVCKSGKAHDAPKTAAAGRSGAAVNGDESRRTAKRRRPSPTEALVPGDAARKIVPAGTTRTEAAGAAERGQANSNSVTAHGLSPCSAAGAVHAVVAPLAADVQGLVKGGDFGTSTVATERGSDSIAASAAALHDAIVKREGLNSRKRTAGAEAPAPTLFTAALVSQEAGCDGGGESSDAQDAKKGEVRNGTQRGRGKVEEDHEEIPRQPQQLSGKAKGRKAACTAKRATASKSSPLMEKRSSEDAVTADPALLDLECKLKGRGSSQGNPIDDMEGPGVATTQPPASQWLQVRGGGGVDDSCTAPHTKVRKLVFALSGFTADERARYGSTLKALRLAYVPVNNDWDPKINALLAPSLKRSDKTVCAMAAGAWLLRADYIAACQGQDTGATQREVGATQGSGPGGVAPEQFELYDCEDGPEVISSGAPAHWRQRLAARGPAGRAFSGLRVLVPPGLPPPLDSATLARMLGAGGGVAVVKAAPSAAKGCHAGVVPPGLRQEDKLVASLQASGAVVVNPAYVVDWVAHPHASLAQHYRHGTSPGEALAYLERDRGVV